MNWIRKTQKAVNFKMRWNSQNWEMRVIKEILTLCISKSVTLNKWAFNRAKKWVNWGKEAQLKMIPMRPQSIRSVGFRLRLIQLRVGLSIKKTLLYSAKKTSSVLKTLSALQTTRFKVSSMTWSNLTTRFVTLKNKTSVINKPRVNYKRQTSMKYVARKNFKFLRQMQKLGYKQEIVNSNRCNMTLIKPKSKTLGSWKHHIRCRMR